MKLACNFEYNIFKHLILSPVCTCFYTKYYKTLTVIIVTTTNNQSSLSRLIITTCNCIYAKV